MRVRRMTGMSSKADIAARRKAPTGTRFLNVELDIYSRSSLEPLVSAFGQKVMVLYMGREHHLYSAHLEIAGMTESADANIHAIAALVHKLPSAKRKLWDADRSRACQPTIAQV